MLPNNADHLTEAEAEELSRGLGAKMLNRIDSHLKQCQECAQRVADYLLQSAQKEGKIGDGHMRELLAQWRQKRTAGGHHDPLAWLLSQYAVIDMKFDRTRSTTAAPGEDRRETNKPGSS